MKIVFFLLLSIFMTPIAFVSSFASTSVQLKLVPTDDRPDILTISPQKIAGASEFSDRVLRLQFQFVAELLEIYSNDEIYFLARDSEYLYDVARLVTQGTDQASHIHLLNTSRALARDINVKYYLIQQGITEDSLKSGRKVRIIDTGLAGTISKALALNFSEEANRNFRTHLMSSSDNLPQTRGALIYIVGDAKGIDEDDRSWVIFSYETLPHYSSRGLEYQKQDGLWRPMGLNRSPENRERKKALFLMKHLKRTWQNEAFRNEFHQRRAYVRKILDYIMANDFNGIRAIIKEPVMPAIRTSIYNGTLTEAIIRDVLEALQYDRIIDDASPYLQLLKESYPVAKCNELLAPTHPFQVY